MSELSVFDKLKSIPDIKARVIDLENRMADNNYNLQKLRDQESALMEERKKITDELIVIQKKLEEIDFSELRTVFDFMRNVVDKVNKRQNDVSKE